MTRAAAASVCAVFAIGAAACGKPYTPRATNGGKSNVHGAASGAQPEARGANGAKPDVHGAANGPSHDITRLVLGDLGSPAFGGQHLEPRCIQVTPAATAGKATVVAARVRRAPGCADKTTSGLLWIYVRADSGRWNEEFMGPAPHCWRGVPPDIAGAVAKASGIDPCGPRASVWRSRSRVSRRPTGRTGS